MNYNLLKGKRGIIFGALNEQSIAWKVAEKAVENGAIICEAFKRLLRLETVMAIRERGLPQLPSTQGVLLFLSSPTVLRLPARPWHVALTSIVCVLSLPCERACNLPSPLCVLLSQVALMTSESQKGPRGSPGSWVG